MDKKFKKIIRKLHSIAFIFFFVTIAPIKSMEIDQGEGKGKHIEEFHDRILRIKDYYGDILEVRQSEVSKLSVIMHNISSLDSYNGYDEKNENYNNSNAQNDYSYDELEYSNVRTKEFGFDGSKGKIDQFIDPLVLIYSDISFYKRKLNNFKPTRKLIKKIMTCTNNPEYAQTIPSHLIPSLIAGADCLGAPEEIYFPLVAKLQNYTGSDDAIHTCMYTHGGNSIATWLDSKENIEDQELDTSFLIHEKTLKLGATNLHTLYGIQRLFTTNIGIQQHDIEKIQLYSNKLVHLDVNNLLQLFPKLKCIEARYNNIKQLNLPGTLPPEFTLDVTNNQIVDVPRFKAGQANTLVFSKNQLSHESKNNLAQACIPNSFEKRKHYPFLARQLSIAAGIGALLGGIFGLGFGMFVSIAPQASQIGNNDAYLSPETKSIIMVIKFCLGIICYTAFKIKQLNQKPLTVEEIGQLNSAECTGLFCMVAGALVISFCRYLTFDDKPYRYKIAHVTL